MTDAEEQIAALQQRVEELTLTVSVEQGKVAYRDKLIAAAEAREQALQQRVEDLEEQIEAVMTGEQP